MEFSLGSEQAVFYGSKLEISPNGIEITSRHATIRISNRQT